jgi:hypothetical protein
MRGSVGRLGSMLLPFNAGRTAAIAARRLAGTAVPGGPLERLHISIQYEARLDYSNAQGRSEAFDVFLVSCIGGKSCLTRVLPLVCRSRCGVSAFLL